MLLMALRNVLILRRPPTGPASGRPEDRLRGRLEGRTVLIQPIFVGRTTGARSRSVSCQIGGDDARENDTVESSGPADACHNNSALLNILEVEEIGADQRPGD